MLLQSLVLSAGGVMIVLAPLITMVPLAVPPFLRRKRILSQGGNGGGAGASGGGSSNQENKAAKRTVEAAESMAANDSGKRKPAKRDILEQLIVILARLVLQNTAELREVTGILFETALVPIDNPLAVYSLAAGQEFQSMLQEQRERKEGQQDSEEEGEQKAMEEDELPIPFLHIATTAIHQTLSDPELEAKLAKYPGAPQAVQELKTTYEEMLADCSEEQMLEIVKVWRSKRPQRQGKTKGVQGKYVKFTLSLAPRLASSVKKFITATGGIYKPGKAPRGWLEREASKLLNKFGR